MTSPFFSDLDLNDFEEDEAAIDKSIFKSCIDLDRKRFDVSFTPLLTVHSCNEQTNSGNDISELSPVYKKQKQSEDIDDSQTRWNLVYNQIKKNYPTLSFIDMIKRNHVKRTPALLLQIESIKKTETGYYCQFSDSSGVIYGTLNNEVVKNHRHHIDVGSILVADSIPVLYITQSGNCYLVITERNIHSVYSKYSKRFFVCQKQFNDNQLKDLSIGFLPSILLL